ncbi:MAG: YbcC family protein [Cytophagaceae bacterium]
MNRSVIENFTTPGLDDNFNEVMVIKELKKYLPSQPPLKDFIFQNPLKAFQIEKFHDALNRAGELYGYKMYYTPMEYNDLYKSGRITEEVLEKVLKEKNKGNDIKNEKNKLLSLTYTIPSLPRIGILRGNWKTHYKLDMDGSVHSLLFKIVCSYLDQGISIWNFPLWNGLLPSIRQMEKKSFTGFFKSRRVIELLFSEELSIEFLLDMLVANKEYYNQYLFDQQFAHSGWSGIVSVIEDQPKFLMDEKKISLKEFIILELLLEIDVLDRQFGSSWKPLASKIQIPPVDLFATVHKSEYSECLRVWQDAYEWSYYDEVLAGIKQIHNREENNKPGSFQAMFCIDERECSFRRYLEMEDPDCSTFGTPGFFNVEFFFQPEYGKSYTKLCPPPVTPGYLIKEQGSKIKREKDVHFDKTAYSFFAGWIISQTIGFWSALKLFLNIFRPTIDAAASTSLRHMDKLSDLTIESIDGTHIENGLQVGFTVEQMAERVEGLLKSIGLVDNFSDIIYVIGHGASSVNNPFYASMDCGACSCRPGSVNARVFSFAANHPKVRFIMRERGINIPDKTIFVGGLHDTTRDDLVFFDEGSLIGEVSEKHKRNVVVFLRALDLNAKERSRRFESIDTTLPAEEIHKLVRSRSMLLSEPRPELDHATNALCIVGRRSLTKGLFLDRRAFMNSYNYKLDPDGKFLLNILKAATPVCGDINLTFYFSKMDNKKLGAGTKLPHNVMGLIGVSNGIEGDLRPGLPSQMIESHEPIRLMMIVEHFPDVVLKTIKSIDSMYEYYRNEWMHLAVIDPLSGEILIFKDEQFVPYIPLKTTVSVTDNIVGLIEKSLPQQNIPVHIIK